MTTPDDEKTKTNEKLCHSTERQNNIISCAPKRKKLQFYRSKLTKNKLLMLSDEFHEIEILSPRPKIL